MNSRSTNGSITEQLSISRRRSAFLKGSPWVLRLADHRGKPSPVMVIKERVFVGGYEDDAEKPRNPRLKDVGIMCGPAMQRCLKPLHEMLARVCDPDGVPLELQRIIATKSITYRGNLPLDEESGSKIALLFILQQRMQDLDRIELIAWRVQRFTREEAVYWLSRASQYGDAPNRWAQSGMRTMLGGQPGDEEVAKMLRDFREQR